MKKVFLDTNVLLRFFLRDDEKQYKDVYKLISFIEKGEFKPYTSTIVFLEVNYVLKNIYELSFKEVYDVLEAIKKIKKISIIEKTDLSLALKFYKKYKIKFGDCFIASQLSKDMILLTFDRDFWRIKGILVKKPKELIGNFGL